MASIVRGSGLVQQGQIVAWQTSIGERRGRVSTLRANGDVRVEVFDRVQGNWSPNGQVVDIPSGLVRPMVSARVQFQAGHIEARAQAGATDLFLYGDIGPGAGIDAPSIKAALRGVNPKSKLSIYLSSPGGSPLEAVAIASIFQRWEGRTITYVDGLAASAATIIAAITDQAYMAPEAMYMIHRSWTLAIGDRDDLMSTLEVLDQIDDNMANIYVRRTGMSKDKILDMMQKETWMNATAAKRNGFVDEVVNPPQRNSGGVNALMNRDWFTRNPDGTSRPLSQPASSTSQVGSQPAAAATALPGDGDPSPSSDPEPGQSQGE